MLRHFLTIAALLAAFVILAGSKEEQVKPMDTGCACPILATVINDGAGTGRVYVNGFLLQCPGAPSMPDNHGTAVCGQASFQSDPHQLRIDIVPDGTSKLDSIPCAFGGGNLGNRTCFIPPGAPGHIASDTYTVRFDPR